MWNSEIGQKRELLYSRFLYCNYVYIYIYPRPVLSGTETIRCLGPKIWKILQYSIKTSGNLKVFKENVKKWIPTNCPCRLCKPFHAGLGFV